jgi:hypothetical protein
MKSATYSIEIPKVAPALLPSTWCEEAAMKYAIEPTKFNNNSPE